MPRALETQAVHIVERVEHAGTSDMGNPTYRVHFRGGTSALTQSNGSVGYDATNHRPRYRDPDVAVIVTFTRAGRIRHLERPDDQAHYLPLVGRTLVEADKTPPRSRVRHGTGRNHA